MLHILLITSRLQALDCFTQALSADSEVRLESVASGAEALDAVRTSPPHLAVIDANLPDIEPRGLVQGMMTVNAMVNTAVVSSLSEEDFHEASEGLGVLSRLPFDPGRDEAETLLINLRKLLRLIP